MPSTSTGVPTNGMLAKAALVSCAPAVISPAEMEATISGCASIVETSTMPVRAQITTVSQKVPVMDTSAWRAGLRVVAAEATMGAEPKPDSFENRPRAQPNWIAAITPLPRRPPKAAWGLKALSKISAIAWPT